MTARTGASRTIAHNTLFNLLGLAAPAVAAIVALPLMLDRLGIEQFGVLTLAYVLVGYLGLFDVGLGRALTQLVARRRGEGDVSSVRALVWTYLWSVTALGVVAGTALAIGSGPLVRDVLNMSSGVQAEAAKSFVLLGAVLPLSLTTPGLRGCLEAYSRFGLVAVVKVPSGLALVLAPLAVVLVRADLVAVMATIVAVRVLTWAAHFWQCRSVIPEITRPDRPRVVLLRPMLSFAGWLSVSNVLAPLMAYFDRFLIGSLVSVSAVAVYSTPFDVVSKLTILPLALTGVLFPAFATLTAARVDAAPLFHASMRWTLVVLLPPVAVVVGLAHALLTTWISGPFADEAGPVLQILAVGVLFNGLAQVPLGLLQGMGRPRDPTLLLLAELPVYLIALVVAVDTNGVLGAAVAWSVRTAVDAVALTAVAQYRLTGSARAAGGLSATPAAVAVVLAGLAGLWALDGSPSVTATALACGLPLALAACWRWLLTPSDRATLLSLRRRAK